MRGSLAALRGRVGDDADETTVAQTAQRFSDVRPDHEAFEAIEWPASAGVTAGYGDGTFKHSEAVIGGQPVLRMPAATPLTVSSRVRSSSCSSSGLPARPRRCRYRRSA